MEERKLLACVDVSESTQLEIKSNNLIIHSKSS
jgi:hypothetical protein